MEHTRLPPLLLHLNKNFFLSGLKLRPSCAPALIDKSIAPKSVSDMKLIHAGKVLENGKTLADSGVHVGDLTGGVITMHVVVQPSVAKQKTGKNQEDEQNQHPCSCTIL